MSERVALKKQNSAAVDAAERDPSVSAVPLIGGGRTFISGIDITAVAFGTGGAGPELQARARAGSRPGRASLRFGKPVKAAGVLTPGLVDRVTNQVNKEGKMRDLSRPDRSSSTSEMSIACQTACRIGQLASAEMRGLGATQQMPEGDEPE
jgi:hypothetical protein